MFCLLDRITIYRNVLEFHEILNEPQLGLLGPLLTPFVLYLEPFAPHVGHDHNRRVESRPRASWHVFRSSLKDRPEKATLAFDFDRVRLEYPRTNDRSPGKLRLSRLRLLLCETFWNLYPRRISVGETSRKRCLRCMLCLTSKRNLSRCKCIWTEEDLFIRIK